MSTTYSFLSTSTTVSHPLIGQHVSNGEGLVSITVAYQDDNTASDIGADGNVMITKVKSRRGTIAIEAQQTSPFNKWMINYSNTVENAAPSYWAQGTIRATEGFDNGITISATQCAIQKRPDHKDEQNGGHVTWTMFSPNITES